MTNLNELAEHRFWDATNIVTGLHGNQPRHHMTTWKRQTPATATGLMMIRRIRGSEVIMLVACLVPVSRNQRNDPKIREHPIGDQKTVWEMASKRFAGNPATPPKCDTPHKMAALKAGDAAAFQSNRFSASVSFSIRTRNAWDTQAGNSRNRDS